MVVDGGDASYGVAGIEGFFAGEDVVALVASGGFVGACAGEVFRSYYGADTFEGFGLGGVDRLDTGMRVGAA